MSTGTVAIPAWTAQGVLPAIDVESPTSSSRSPYRVSLLDFVVRFGSTDARRTLLRGLLEYRAALHALDLVGGFQWLDGSFLEDVETVERRQPRDIDLVTFFRLPEGRSQTSLEETSAELFDPEAVGRRYGVHAFFVQLSEVEPELLVDHCTYWNSLWSHRRNGQWKGYLQVDLAPAGDREAMTNLDLMSNE
ncbi:MAG: hypothetical protein OXG35_26370 [Acidobacteria bacterium]|nr:hypothetical protein [Acidobacteriota bacterium]